MTVPYVNKFRPAEHALPRSWLAADYSDLIAQAETAADDPAPAEEPAALDLDAFAREGMAHNVW